MLFSQMSPPPGEQAAFERWYDTDHITHRMALPGFSRAHRLWDVDGDGHHLAVYELESLAALETPAYQELKRAPGAQTEHFLGAVSGFTRFTTEQLSDRGVPGVVGAYLSVVAFAVPDDEVADFEHWYADEHEPLLLAAPSWLRIHRYRVLSGDGGPWTHLALHELADRAVMGSPERERARNAPLRNELSGRPWFTASGRWLYRRSVTHYSTGTG